MSTFDPAAHLSKQGWKGKGTALKQGHATRPLAVVQKKNLSGIGKDRDEAVPFWDQIFAATAASIFSPSPSGSGTSTPLSTNVAHSSTRSWTTTTFGQSIPLPKPGTGVSTAARVSKEQARRGLYSRFMRGKVVVPESESEDEAERSEGKDKAERSEGMGKSKSKDGDKGVAEIKEGVAGPSTPMTEEVVSSKKSKGKGKETKGEETKEEKRIRKAEKAKRKEEKEARRALKSTQAGTSTTIAAEEEGGKLGRKRKDLDLGEDGVGKVKKVKKEKKEKITPTGDAAEGEKEGKKEKVKKEKRKKEQKIGEES